MRKIERTSFYNSKMEMVQQVILIQVVKRPNRTDFPIVPPEAKKGSLVDKT
jgi:hypothetical protein